jgi:zinc D-Ala-D-Ala carboxypeptidase
MKNLSKYFSVRELTFSKIAEDHGIDNTPIPDILETLKYTALQLDKVRELLNKPVNISSGYRCLQVNRRLGSKDSSQHLKAEAVDFKCELFGNPRAVFEAIRKSNIQFDQLILEFNSWVHISFVKEGGRRECLIIDRFGVERIK